MKKLVALSFWAEETCKVSPVKKRYFIVFFKCVCSGLRQFNSFFLNNLLMVFAPQEEKNIALLVT